jgi:hypothetical protein
MYSFAVQTAKAVHTRSEDAPGAADSNWPAVQPVVAWHCLADVVVAAMDSY